MMDAYLNRAVSQAFLATLLAAGIGCSADDSGATGAKVGGAGTTAGTAGNEAAGSGGSTGGTASTAGSAGDGTGGGNAGTGGSGGSNTGAADASTDSASVVHDASSDALSIGDAINGTPDGGAYSRAGWTATSVPPFPTGQKAQNQDLKYSNAFDGNNNTRWSIGDTNSPAQTIGDQFTFDMKAPHVFKKIVFWAGGVNGMNGPDPRDYPGALDVSVSTDCTTFGPTIGSGTEAQPGCNTCSMPFTITLAQPVVAQCVRLTLTKRLQLGGGIWWAISELYVYP